MFFLFGFLTESFPSIHLAQSPVGTRYPTFLPTLESQSQSASLQYLQSPYQSSCRRRRRRMGGEEGRDKRRRLTKLQKLPGRGSQAYSQHTSQQHASTQEKTLARQNGLVDEMCGGKAYSVKIENTLWRNSTTNNVGTSSFTAATKYKCPLKQLIR